MEMNEIDLILADDLQPGDTVKMADGFVTVVERLEEYSDEYDDYVRFRGDDDEEYAFSWDDNVTLYGYTD